MLTSFFCSAGSMSTFLVCTSAWQMMHTRRRPHVLLGGWRRKRIWRESQEHLTGHVVMLWPSQMCHGCRTLSIGGLGPLSWFHHSRVSWDGVLRWSQLDWRGWYGSLITFRASLCRLLVLDCHMMIYMTGGCILRSTYYLWVSFV